MPGMELWERAFLVPYSKPRAAACSRKERRDEGNDLTPEFEVKRKSTHNAVAWCVLSKLQKQRKHSVNKG
jgi:hypothetical protein